mmetsp:Transcript_109755/g.342107  ORF Transcript_109755/g.342107 Transcript_109755/m.342107 type:complete len:222 (+) Transcript_109755:72-737(+)
MWHASATLRCCGRRARRGARPSPILTHPKDGARSSYFAVHLPLHGSGVEQTQDAAVFIKSPTRQRRRLRHLAAQSRCRAASAPAVRGRRGSDSGMLMRKSLTDCSTEEESRCQQLRDGIMQRASEQLLVANLKQLARRQCLRYGGRAPGSASTATAAGLGSSSAQRRWEASAVARDFSELYCRTINTLEKYMTLSPPSRRHSVTIPDLAAYASPKAVEDNQ